MYHLFGYTDDCKEISIYFDSFIVAIKTYLKYRNIYVLFIARNGNTIKYIM